MKSLILSLTLLMLFTSVSQPAEAQNVFVNGKALSSETIQMLESYYKIKCKDGRYWYDRESGLWGIEGQPAQGIILPGMDLGGNMRADASAGSTDVFINGREITLYELAELVNMTQTYITPGRYFLNSKGYAGLEGMPVSVNLFQIASRYYGQNKQSGFYRNRYTGIGSGSSGSTFYVIGKEFSYIN